MQPADVVAEVLGAPDVARPRIDRDAVSGFRTGRFAGQGGESRQHDHKSPAGIHEPDGRQRAGSSAEREADRDRG